MEVDRIYLQFYESLLYFIKSKIKSKHDAEDILQNVFIKISTHIDTLSEEGKLQSWVYAITRNAIVDHYRAHAHKNAPLDDYVENSLPDTATTDTIPELDQCVSSMIALLPEEYRAIVIDAEINGIKQKDLAIKYNMTYSSLRSRVQRGKVKLKQLFHDCCHIQTDSTGNVLEARIKAACNLHPCISCQE